MSVRTLSKMQIGGSPALYFIRPLRWALWLNGICSSICTAILVPYSLFCINCHQHGLSDVWIDKSFRQLPCFFSGDINFNYSNFLTLINYVPTVIRLSSDVYICVCTYLYYCTSYIINNNNNIIIIIIAFSFLNSVASLLISRATTVVVKRVP